MTDLKRQKTKPAGLMLGGCRRQALAAEDLPGFVKSVILSSNVKEYVTHRRGRP